MRFLIAIIAVAPTLLAQKATIRAQVQPAPAITNSVHPNANPINKPFPPSEIQEVKRNTQYPEDFSDIMPMRPEQQDQNGQMSDQMHPDNREHQRPREQGQRKKHHKGKKGKKGHQRENLDSNEENFNDEQEMPEGSDRRRGHGFIFWAFVVSAIFTFVFLMKRCIKKRCASRRMKRQCMQQMQQMQQQPQEQINHSSLQEQIRYHQHEAMRLQSMVDEQEHQRQQANKRQPIPQNLYYPQMMQRQEIVGVYHQQPQRIPMGRPLVEENISEIYPRME